MKPNGRLSGVSSGSEGGDGGRPLPPSASRLNGVGGHGGHRGPQGRCQAIGRTGRPCEAPARQGSSFCSFHDPKSAEAIQEGRRAGGRERSKPAATVEAQEPDLPVATAQDIIRLIGDTISRVRKGTLDVRVGNTIGYLASVALRALEVGDIEERFEQVEAAIKASAAHAESGWGEGAEDDE